MWFQNRFKKHFYMENSEKNCTNQYDKPKKTSIIVCARNEEKHIENVLKALLNQDCDFSLVEIIIANDQSTDNTESIIRKYSDNYDFIKTFQVLDRDATLSPKKNALKQAIKVSTGEIILLTDADCIPSPSWLKSHIEIYESYPMTEMVVGFTKTILENDNIAIPLCSIFEHMDFLILMFAAQGAIQSGKPFSCSGQNLSYLKKSFDEVSAFDEIEHYISGDDLLLMQKFVKKGKIIKFAAFKDAYTETVSLNSWRKLINQRARWASNFKAMYRINLHFFVYLLACFMCLGLMPFLIPLYILKIMFDERFIKFALSQWNLDDMIFKKKYSIFGVKFNYLQCWYILCPFYILTVTTLGMFSVFKWKDRRG